MIIIVDDDPAVRESLGALLESHGHHVELFESGEEFLRSSAVDRSSGLFLDLNLTGMNGFEVLGHLSRKAPRRPVAAMPVVPMPVVPMSVVPMPVVLMTGRIDGKLRELAAGSGAWALLQKPLAADTVLAMIDGFALRAASA